MAHLFWIIPAAGKHFCGQVLPFDVVILAILFIWSIQSIYFIWFISLRTFESLISLKRKCVEAYKRLSVDVSIVENVNNVEIVWIVNCVN